MWFLMMPPALGHCLYRAEGHCKSKAVETTYRVAACAGLRLTWLTVSSFPLLLLSPPLPALLLHWPPLASHTDREGHPSVKIWYLAAPQIDPASPFQLFNRLSTYSKFYHFFCCCCFVFCFKSETLPHPMSFLTPLETSPDLTEICI